MFLTMIGTWNVTDKDRLDSPLSRSKVMRNEFEGLIVPSEFISSLHYVGKD